MSGTPELSTKWLKDGKELTSDSKYKISFFNKVSGLKIINVAPGDSGVYSFEVQNLVGKDSCTVSIQVSGWLACSFALIAVGTPTVLKRSSILPSIARVFTSSGAAGSEAADMHK